MKAYLLLLCLSMAFCDNLPFSQFFPSKNDERAAFIGVEPTTGIKSYTLNDTDQLTDQLLMSESSGVTSYALAFGYQSYRLLEVKFLCSVDCIVYISNNNTLDTVANSYKIFQPAFPFSQSQRQPLTDSYFLYYFKPKNSSQDLRINITLNYSKLHTLEVEELNKCYASPNCFNKLLYTARYPTTIRFIYLSETNSITNFNFQLGPLNTKNMSYLFIMGNQELRVDEFRLQSDGQIFYYQVFKNESDIDYTNPSQVEFGQSVNIIVNQTLQNSWVAILVYIGSGNVDMKMDVVSNRLQRLFVQPIRNLCQGGSAVGLDCTNFCQDLTVNKRYYINPLDLFGYFCFTQNEGTQLTAQMISKQVVKIDESIYEKGTQDFRVVQPKYTNYSSFGSPGRETSMLYLPYGNISMVVYNTPDIGNDDPTYIKALREEDQVFLKLIRRQLCCTQPKANIFLQYSSQDDFCNFVCFYNKGQQRFVVAKEDNTEVQFYYGCLKEKGDTNTSFWYGYFSNETISLSCPPSNILVFRSSGNLAVGLFPESTVYQRPTFSSLESVAVIKCSQQNKSIIESKQNIFRNWTAPISYIAPTVPTPVQPIDSPSNSSNASEPAPTKPTNESQPIASNTSDTDPGPTLEQLQAAGELAGQSAGQAAGLEAGQLAGARAGKVAGRASGKASATSYVNGFKLTYDIIKKYKFTTSQIRKFKITQAQKLNIIKQSTLAGETAGEMAGLYAGSQAGKAAGKIAGAAAGRKQGKASKTIQSAQSAGEKSGALAGTKAGQIEGAKAGAKAGTQAGQKEAKAKATAMVQEVLRKYK